MAAPRLAWVGGDPVVVGETFEYTDGETGAVSQRVRVWRFVAGSESSALPDELDYGDAGNAGYISRGSVSELKPPEG